MLVILIAFVYSVSGESVGASSENSWDIDFTQILTAVLAIWGAGLSTYNTYQQRRMNKPNINIEIQDGHFNKILKYSSWGPESEKDVPAVIFVAINKGQKAITLDDFDLRLRDNEKINVDFQKERLTYTQDNLTFPCELLPGKRVGYHIYIEDIAQALREMGYSGKMKLIGSFKDQTGKVYSSSSYCLDIDDYSEINS